MNSCSLAGLDKAFTVPVIRIPNMILDMTGAALHRDGFQSPSPWSAARPMSTLPLFWVVPMGH